MTDSIQDPIEIDVSGVNIWTKVRIPEGYIKAEFIKLEHTDYGVRFYLQPDGYKQFRVSVKLPNTAREISYQDWKKIQKSFSLPSKFKLSQDTFLDRECWVFCEHSSGYNGYDYDCFVTEGSVAVGKKHYEENGVYPESNKGHTYKSSKPNKPSKPNNPPDIPQEPQKPKKPVPHPRARKPDLETPPEDIQEVYEDLSVDADFETYDPYAPYDPDDPNSGIPF